MLAETQLTLHRFVHTPILSDQVVEHLKNQGIKFATVEDCAQAMLRIVTDKSINGERYKTIICGYLISDANAFRRSLICDSASRAYQGRLS